jgi:hypothetical protein
LLIGRSCQDDVVDIGASSAATISDSFAAASDMNSIVLLLYYYMMMLMRSLVVLSLFFDDEEQNQTTQNSKKTRVSLSLSLFPFSLFSRNRHKLHTNLLFYSFLLKQETILKVFASNKRIKHTHTHTQSHAHAFKNQPFRFFMEELEPSFGTFF